MGIFLSRKDSRHFVSQLAIRLPKPKRRAMPRGNVARLVLFLDWLHRLSCHDSKFWYKNIWNSTNACEVPLSSM